MRPTPTWQQVRNAGLALTVLTAGFALMGWFRHGNPFGSGAEVALIAALAAWMVCLYLWSQSRSTDRE